MCLHLDRACRRERLGEAFKLLQQGAQLVAELQRIKVRLQQGVNALDLGWHQVQDALGSKLRDESTSRQRAPDITLGILYTRLLC